MDWSPLVSAGIAAAVALLVAVVSGSNARRAWLYTERQKAYVAVVDALSGLFGSLDYYQKQQEAMDPARIRAMVDACHRLDLVAPAAVRSLADKIYDRLPRSGVASMEQLTQAATYANPLKKAMRDDLVPSKMR